MNSVSLLGRLTKAPEIRYTQGDNPMAIASFTLAVDRRFKKDTTDFIRCKAFGKTAETIEKYVKQGMKIAVTGSIQTGDYTDKDGKKVYTTDVVVDAFDFCESKGTSDNKPQQDNGFVAIPDGIDEELPFN